MINSFNPSLFMNGYNKLIKMDDCPSYQNRLFTDGTTLFLLRSLYGEYNIFNGIYGTNPTLISIINIDKWIVSEQSRTKIMNTSTGNYYIATGAIAENGYGTIYGYKYTNSGENNDCFLRMFVYPDVVLYNNPWIMPNEGVAGNIINHDVDHIVAVASKRASDIIQYFNAYERSYLVDPYSYDAFTQFGQILTNYHRQINIVKLRDNYYAASVVQNNVIKYYRVLFNNNSITATYSVNQSINSQTETPLCKLNDTTFAAVTYDINGIIRLKIIKFNTDNTYTILQENVIADDGITTWRPISFLGYFAYTLNYPSRIISNNVDTIIVVYFDTNQYLKFIKIKYLASNNYSFIYTEPKQLFDKKILFRVNSNENYNNTATVDMQFISNDFFILVCNLSDTGAYDAGTYYSIIDSNIINP